MAIAMRWPCDGHALAMDMPFAWPWQLQPHHGCGHGTTVAMGVAAITTIVVIVAIMAILAITTVTAMKGHHSHNMFSKPQELNKATATFHSHDY
jgi:hypothetical protein